MSSLIKGYQIDIPFYLSGSKGTFLFSGSYVEINSTTSSTDFFIIKDNGQQVFKVNQQGVVEFKEILNTPTVVTGGLFYSGSDDWFLYYKQ
ncbi:MAG: hypothetical protein FJ167_05975 [Gammaproteobacteria bacterium]|nr:hypothetical protein [Gammaproteobacteria bacterium]